MDRASSVLTSPTFRLSILWLTWSLATTVGYAVGWIVKDNWATWLLLTDFPDQHVSSHLAALLEGGTLGIFIGLLQFSVLRYHLPGLRWRVWVILTVIGHAIGSSIAYLLTLNLEMPNPYWSYPELWIGWGLIGLITGVLQVPLLGRIIPGTRCWLWLIPSVTAPLLSGFMWAIAYEFSLGYSFHLGLGGALYGLISGIALFFLLRSAAISQVKDKSQAS